MSFCTLRCWWDVAERPCPKCGETFLPLAGRKICSECIGEREPFDVVRYIQGAENMRLDKGLRMVHDSA